MKVSFGKSALPGEIKAEQRTLYPEKQVLNDTFRKFNAGQTPRLRLRFKRPKVSGSGGGTTLGG